MNVGGFRLTDSKRFPLDVPRYVEVLADHGVEGITVKELFILPSFDREPRPPEIESSLLEL